MGDYPRLLKLDDDTKQRLISYVESELENHLMERDSFVQRIMDYQKAYWAEPAITQRTFPFTGASNIIVPLIAITVEAVYARIWTTLGSVKPFISAKSRPGGDFQNVEKPLEDYIDYELLTNLRVMKSTSGLSSSIMENIKFGQCIGKSGYVRIVRKAVRQGPSGEDEEFSVIIREDCTIENVPNTNFVMPFYCNDPQFAPWCGEFHDESPFQVKLLQDSGFFYDDVMEKLEGYLIGRISGGQEYKAVQQQESLEKRTPVWPTTIGWYELWMSFDIDGDDKEEEIVIHYNRDIRDFLAVRYNWNADLSRSYRTGVYFPVENRWTGVGVCKQVDQFQKEATVIHRQRLDNATIANMRMFKIHKLSGYGPKEPLFPGKLWFVDDMTHVEAVQAGEVYQSSYANEQSVVLYNQMRSGVNELTLGMPQAGTPGTATSDLSRLQEGKQKFDSIYKNTRGFVGELVSDLIVNLAQFDVRRHDYFDAVEGGALVRDFLNQDVNSIRRGILIDIAVAGQQQNRIVDRQNWQQIAQMMQQYFVGLIQLSEMIGDPRLSQTIAIKGVVAANEAMKQILETFDIRNIDRMVVTELEGILNNGAQGLLNAGRNGGNAAANPAAGMDALSQVSRLLSTGSR